MRGHVFVIVALAAVAGCGDNSHKAEPQPDLSTPEGVVANAHDGDAVTVTGTVSTLTFDDTLGADQNFTPSKDRWLLIRDKVPKGVTLADLDSGSLQAAWGLGVHITGDLAAQTLPQIGDQVKVSGTFQHSPWAGQMMPVLEHATITVVHTTTTLKQVGDPCSVDVECHDQLICDRATSTCAAPPPVVWESPYHDVNGVCSTDADCPSGQRCDTTYQVPASGDYTPAYFAQTDVGKSLCVLDDQHQTLATACPRILTTADLSGGRFIQGKEVCVQGSIWLAVHADDRDTHVQMNLNEPLPYPKADTTYWIFGSTTENTPPMKDPARAVGPVVDPKIGDTVVAVGTVRYDPSHGWWEVHPVKQYFMVQAKAATLAEMKARYPTHPGDLDIDALENQWGPDEADLAAHAPR